MILIFILVFSYSITCSAKEYNNFNDLIENSKKINNSKISLKGEAIGEVMNRGEFSWVNISDGSTAMGIWVDSRQAQIIKNYGKYGYKGDIVQVDGTFNRACAEHGGDMDVHVSSVKVIETGGSLSIPISNSKKAIASILTVITFSLIFLYKKRPKKIS